MTATALTAPTDGGEVRVSRRNRWYEPVSVLAVMGLAGLLILTANWNRRIPTIFADEAGTLGSARWLAGGANWSMARASSTDIGYPLLLAPIFALVDSPARTYRLVVLLNVVLAMLMLAVLYVLARRGLGARHSSALAAATCATAYPAVTMQSGVAWVEVTTMLGIAVLVTTVVLAVTRVTPALLLVHGTTAAYLSYVHGRFTALPVLTLLALLAVAVARPQVRWWAFGATGLTVAVMAGLRQLDEAAHAARWEWVGHPEISLSTVLSVPLPAQLRSVAGQGWYLVAGTYGALVLGIVVLLAFTATRAPGPRREGIAGPGAAAYLLLVLTSVFAISVTYISSGVDQNPAPRADYAYYGRYNESFVPTLIAVGVVAMLMPRWRRCAVWCLGAAALAGPALLGLALALGHGQPFTGRVQPKMLAAVDPLIGLDASGRVASALFVVPPTIAASAVAVVLALLAHLRWQRLAPAVVLVVFGLLATSNAMRDANDAKGNQALIQTYHALHERDPETVAFDPATVSVRGFFAPPFWLNESRFVPFDSAPDSWPAADLYLGPVTWPAAQAHGLRLVAIDRFAHCAFYAAAP